MRSKEIRTAQQFSELCPHWVRSELTINGWRMQQELQGTSYLGLELNPVEPKSVMYSRSLARPVRGWKEMEQVVSYYASELARKLRKKKVKVVHLRLFIRGGYGVSQYKSSGVVLPLPSSDTREILQCALAMLRKIWSTDRFPARKVGLLALQLDTESARQLDLFSPPYDDSVMRVIDGINQRFGRDTIRFAVAERPVYKGSWAMKQERRSPRYTTRWSELPVIRL